MSELKRRIAVHFPRFGPYHLARIGAAVNALQSADCEVVGIEVAGSDVTYEWRQEKQQTTWERRTIFPNDDFERIPNNRLVAGMINEFDRLKPTAVAICGYATADARAALRWCKKNRATAILMAETRKADGNRVWWKEWIKSRLIKQFDSALCGGIEHRKYLVELGMPNDRIQTGYDVVDNQHFADEANRVRVDDHAAVRPYFLSSNRFIARKNLITLIKAYHNYVRQESSSTSPWPLVLLGDGEQKGELMELCRSLQLPIHLSAPWEPSDWNSSSAAPAVFFPGFRQIDELPRFYAHAGCFIHPAIAEPWGLVLNEAMACSLPVLATTGTGSAADLIDDGKNGWRFDAHSDQTLASLMSKMAAMPDNVRKQFGNCAWLTVEQRCPLSAFGTGLAAAIKRTGSQRS